MRRPFHHNDIVEEIATRRQGRIEPILRKIKKADGKVINPDSIRALHSTWDVTERFGRCMVMLALIAYSKGGVLL